MRRSHLLNDDQRDGGGDQRPQQRISKLRAGLRIGENSAGVIIGVGRNEAGPSTDEKREIRYLTTDNSRCAGPAAVELE